MADLGELADEIETAFSGLMEVLRERDAQEVPPEIVEASLSGLRTKLEEVILYLRRLREILLPDAAGIEAVSEALEVIDDRLARLEHMTGCDPITVTQTPAGITIGLGEDFPSREQAGAEPCVFPVLVTCENPADHGDAQTSCTFTYTVNNLYGVTLKTGMTPQRARYGLIEYDVPPADSYGLACRDADGGLVLLDVLKEIALVDTCP
jgi:hypothetical protein